MEEQILPSLDDEIQGERHRCQLETVTERVVATLGLLSRQQKLMRGRL